MGFSLITQKPPSVIRVGNKISFPAYREEAHAICRGWEWSGSGVGRTEKPALSTAVVNHSLLIPRVSQLTFQTVVLEKTLVSPLDCKEIKLVNPKWNQP